MTVLMVAAIGTENSAPTIPATNEPAASDSSTATRCSDTAWPMRNGCRTWPAICCTARTTISIHRAVAGPFYSCTTRIPSLGEGAVEDRMPPAALGDNGAATALWMLIVGHQ